jgi:hypothetical protein
MRENGFKIAPVGLRVDVNSPDGAAYLKNLKPMAGRLETPGMFLFPWADQEMTPGGEMGGFEMGGAAMGGNPTMWPFPQLIVGQNFTFLCTADTVYSVASDNTLTWLFTAPAPVSEIWHLAEFKTDWVLTNGTYVFFTHWRELE